MSEESPLAAAQQQFVDALPFRSLDTESCQIPEALGRILATDLLAPEDLPPYPRAIVEGFLVHTAETAQATEDSPVSFSISGEIKPGDSSCPALAAGQALRVATGSIVSGEDLSVVRMWEAQVQDDQLSITRPFPPRFFIEEQGCDLHQGDTVLKAGSRLSAADIGTIASFGIDSITVARRPRVTIFSSGDEVIPYTETLRPGAIRDSNAVMLAAAVTAAGGIPRLAGIMNDDFEAFLNAVKQALGDADMILISGGTAVGGRDFIAELVSATGKLVIDGVPMRSGRPLIMGTSEGKAIVCVAGHPPEALRGFQLFGTAAIDRLTGHPAALPADTA